MKYIETIMQQTPLLCNDKGATPLNCVLFKLARIWHNCIEDQWTISTFRFASMRFKKGACHLGFADCGELVMHALTETIATGMTTADAGGRSNTRDVTEAVCSRIRMLAVTAA